MTSNVFITISQLKRKLNNNEKQKQKNKYLTLAGSYCEEAGLSAPTGLCEEGYYCNGGATVKNPDSLSDEGYQGETCVDRVNATSNDLCPAAHFCPNGERRFWL